MPKLKLEDEVLFISPIPVKKSETRTDYKVIFPAKVVNSKVEGYEFGEISLKKKVDEKYFVKKNDILLQIKGNKFDSMLIDKDLRNTLPSNTYLILRLKSDKILPKYLQWYLNTKTITEYFEKNTSGAIIKILRKNTISDLVLNAPSIEEQEKIIEMLENFELEKRRLLRYLENKEELIEMTIMKKYGEIE